MIRKTPSSRHSHWMTLSLAWTDSLILSNWQRNSQRWFFPTEMVTSKSKIKFSISRQRSIIVLLLEPNNRILNSKALLFRSDISKHTRHIVLDALLSENKWADYHTEWNRKVGYCGNINCSAFDSVKEPSGSHHNVGSSVAVFRARVICYGWIIWRIYTQVHRRSLIVGEQWRIQKRFERKPSKNGRIFYRLIFVMFIISYPHFWRSCRSPPFITLLSQLLEKNMKSQVGFQRSWLDKKNAFKHIINLNLSFLCLHVQLFRVKHGN